MTISRAVLTCPNCSTQHIDRGKWATFDHKRHRCEACGKFFEVPEPNVGVKVLAPVEGPPCPTCGVTDIDAPCLSAMGDKPGNPLPYRHGGRAPPRTQGRLFA